MRARQTEDAGVIAIMRRDRLGEAPAGVFESAELLAWVEGMATKTGFEQIAEVSAR